MLRQTAKLCCLALGIGLGVFSATGAQAVPVTTTVDGVVDVALATNPFGLAVGDPVSAVAVYDDSLIPAVGNFTLEIDSNAAFSLTITLGSFTFQETDDDLFGSGHPGLLFSNGDLVGLEFGIDSFALGGFPDLQLTGLGIAGGLWFLDDFENFPPTFVNLLEGSWDFANAVTVPIDDPTDVPEPASWPLLAGGLIGLFVFQRRYRAAGNRPA